MKKCLWALSSPLEENYHDTQWGIPLHDDQKLFEYLILETQQTGLSWRTILKKQALMKEAYHQFGNSVAIPVIKRLAKEIVEQLLKA